MYRQTHPEAPRKGVILLVVLAMLTLFAVVGIAFVIYASAEATTNEAYVQTGGINAFDSNPELLLAMSLGQILYGVNDDESGVYSASAIEAAVFGHHQLRHPSHVRIFLPESLSKTPMCGGAFAIEHAGSCHQAHPGAHTGNRYALFVQAQQPGDYGSIPFHHIVDADPCGRDKN